MNKRILFFPKNILFGFLLLTLVMFSVSPWEWPLENPFIFYSLNILYILVFVFGYNNGIKRFTVSSYIKYLNFSRIFSLSLLVNLLFIYHKFLFNLKVLSISLSGLIDSIILGLFSPSVAYAAKHESTFTDYLSLSNPLIFIYFISLPLQYFAIPLGIFYWKKIKKWQKSALSLIILTDILSFIAIGTNKGIFDYIILIPIMIVAASPKILLGKLFVRKKLKIFNFTFIFLALGLVYFTAGNKGRKKDDFELDTSTGKTANRDALVLELIPDFLEDGYIALDNYLTQGYYAMGLAIDLDHKFTYGVGHNSFFISLIEKSVGKDEIVKKTYQYRIEEVSNYSRTGKWHTAYVWMANDLSFLGVAVFVFLVGFFLSLIWLDILKFNNPYAIILLPLFFIMILYFPANNQVLGNQSSSTIFWCFFYLWYQSRGKKFILN
jgi:hypothetical protein